MDVACSDAASSSTSSACRNECECDVLYCMVCLCVLERVRESFGGAEVVISMCLLDNERYPRQRRTVMSVSCMSAPPAAKGLSVDTEIWEHRDWMGVTVRESVGRQTSTGGQRRQVEEIYYYAAVPTATSSTCTLRLPTPRRNIDGHASDGRLARRQRVAAWPSAIEW